jgi:hypothetical protein
LKIISAALRVNGRFDAYTPENKHPAKVREDKEDMGSLARFLYKVADNIDKHPLPQPIKIFLGAGVIYGVSIYLVYSKPTTKPGHDLGSSEKPQAIRNETVRTLESEKRLLALADASKQK